MSIPDQVHWHLDEAERLDKLAANHPPTPPAVASVDDMTQDWVEATLGPDLLRQQAQNHRAHAARLARKANR